MYTFTPASTKPSAIIEPMPRLPPVTSAVFPAMSKRSEAVMAQCASRSHGAANASALRTRTPAPTRSDSSSTRKVGLWCMPLEPSAAPPPTKK